jgi:hypothetical protein
MAVVTKRIEVHRRLGLNATPTMQIAQYATSTYVKGAPVYISGGYLVASPLDSVGTCSLIGTAAGDISGFVQEDGAASGSDASKVGMTPAIPEVTFKGQLIDSTGDSNAGALATIEQTDLGAHMGLGKCSGDTHLGVDKGIAGSRDCVIVTELIDPVGTVGGLVGFVIRDTWNTWRL